MTVTPLLQLDGVSKSFRGRGGEAVAAVSDVDACLHRSERVGVIGGSGAGKSTIARLVVGLLTPDRGDVLLDGRPLAQYGRRELGRRVHLIFQDPYAALPPQRTVEQVVGEPLAIHGIADRRTRVAASLREVQLTPPERYARRWPHELSGGERQRVALARALVVKPDLVVADEPAQMLDAPVRSDLLRLMDDIGRRHDVAYLYVTHDLALAQQFCQRLIVLHDGRVVEEGATASVIATPRSPQARDLVAAAEQLEPGARDWRAGILDSARGDR